MNLINFWVFLIFSAFHETIWGESWLRRLQLIEVLAVDAGGRSSIAV